MQVLIWEMLFQMSHVWIERRMYRRVSEEWIQSERNALFAVLLQRQISIGSVSQQCTDISILTSNNTEEYERENSSRTRARTEENADVTQTREDDTSNLMQCELIVINVTSHIPTVIEPLGVDVSHAQASKCVVDTVKEHMLLSSCSPKCCIPKCSMHPP